MRLFDAEVDVESLIAKHEDIGYEKGYRDGYAEALTDNADPVKHGQWTPCSERLPKDGVYLVYAPKYQGGSSSSKEWHDGVMFAKRKNGKWSVEHGYYSRPNCVKAWMPLPKPYEVEEDD